MRKFKFTPLNLVQIPVTLGLMFGSLPIFAEVTPPPLPLGSAQIKIEAGQSPVEQKRMLNAHKHHHRAHHKKDMTRDDTMDDKPDLKLNNANNDSSSPPVGKRTNR